MKETNKSFPKLMLIWMPICGVLGYAAGVAIAIAQKGWEIARLIDMLGLILLACGLVFGFAIALYARFFRHKSDKPKTTTGITASGDEFALHADSRWMTKEDLLKDRGLINTSWAMLPSVKNIGSVVRSELVGGKLEVTMKDEFHTLIIGTTGTGKTARIISPSIRIYSHSGEKPSLVITDPKGELYALHAKALLEEGYDVQVYDLNNPYASSRWNPMENPFDTYQRAMSLYKEAHKYSGCTPQQAHKEAIDGATYGDTWFEFDGIAFPDEASLNQQLDSMKQQLVNKAKNDLRGVAQAICPVSKGTNDTMWEQGAQDFLYGIMLAMLEDSVDPRLGDKKLRKDQFNFYNLYKIATKQDPDPDNPYNTIRRYCSGRAKTSEVGSVTSTVVNAAANTMKSYLSVMGAKINQLLGDMGICYATSGTDINFKEFVDRPTAFFIKIPDHKKERHPLATICIAQLYRTLVDIAEPLPKQQLPRHVVFLLDEFGNLPALQDFGSMVTVSRSRRILLNIVLQAYSQLDTNYDEKTAKTVLGNFNAEIFLGTENMDTRKEFSESCGEIQLTTEEEQVTKQKGKDSESTSTSKNVQRTTRPLISPQELTMLRDGDTVVRLLNRYPLRVKFAGIWEAPQCFTSYPPLATARLAKALNEEAVYYDIEKRNSILMGAQRPSYF